MIKRAKSQGQAVVVFPEIIRSNGEGILEFKKAFDGLEKSADPVRTHIFAFRYVAR